MLTEVNSGLRSIGQRILQGRDDVLGIYVLHWHHTEPFSPVEAFKFRVSIVVISPTVLLVTGICSSRDTGASFGTTKPNMICGKMRKNAGRD